MDEPKGSSEPSPSPAPEKAKAKPARAGEVDEEALRASVPCACLDRLRAAIPDAAVETSFHCGVPIVDSNWRRWSSSDAP